MQTHLMPRALKGPGRTAHDAHALFAVRPDRKALIFIHGFSGEAIKTWADFHELLPGCPECAGRDIYFYGYDGLYADVNSSAAIFRGFLDRVLGSTASLLAANLPPAAERDPRFAYDDLVIVAHSLGAVISRRALLDATTAKHPWVSKVSLVLFAPAHRGARIVDLVVDSISGFSFLKLFGAAARFKSPLIDDLDPASETLRQLLDDTRAAVLQGHRHLIAKRVVLAAVDHIVVNGRFPDDPPPDAIPGTTHTTVCKPRSDFTDPLDLLRTCL